MNNYIFNWEKNCEKILKDKKYTTIKNRIMEQIFLFAYLKKKGMDEDEIYNIWLNDIEEPEYRNTVKISDDNKRKYFDLIWSKAKNIEIKKTEKIILYKNEIDYINSLQTSLWVKQYILSMLCVYKFFASDWCEYKKNIKTFCYSCTSLGRERIDSIKILNEAMLKYNLYDIIMKNNKLYYKMNFCNNKGEVEYELEDPRQISEIIDCLKCEKVCSICGKTFTYTYRTKNMDKCHECWLKERNKVNRSKKRRHYENNI